MNAKQTPFLISCTVLAGGLIVAIVLAESPAASPPANDAATTSSGAATVASDAERWWSHVEVLAADDLEGRNTGSEGYRKAAEYVAAQFAKYGAQPAGTDGFLQPIEFVSRRIRESESSLAIVRDGRTIPLELGQDANLGMGIEPAPEIEAEAVFVGYGLSIPEIGYDDLEGVDLRGKIAVLFRGGPSSIPEPLRSHAQSTRERWKALRAAGAVGVASVGNPKQADVPWKRSTLRRLQPSMTHADEKLDETPGQRIAIGINPARAEKFFAGSGHRFSEILRLAEGGKSLPRFPLAGKIRARIAHDRKVVSSPNVIGLLPGTDPVLAAETVVLSAHLDHLGVGGAVRRDSIYNGAMDNASGVASLIEIARLVSEGKVEHRRSILLLAVTGEEKGLLGSEYFTSYPTPKAGRMVADVNMDMFMPIVPFRALTVYGLDESDLGDLIREVGSRFGVRVEPDPEPRRNLFIRSDQYSFIRTGVPALAFKFGAGNESEKKLFKRWLTERYHAPSDDLQQPVRKDEAVRFTRLLLDFTLEIANRPERPRWKDGSFFKRFAIAN